MRSGPRRSGLNMRVNSLPQLMQPCVMSSQSGLSGVASIDVTIIRPPQ